MEYIDLIIKLGAFVAAAIGIWKCVSNLVKLRNDFNEVKETVTNNLDNVKEIPKIAAHCEENYLTGLRLTIMSDEMPMGERIVAGKKYIDFGGNGDVKKYLIEELHINDVKN